MREIRQVWFVRYSGNLCNSMKEKVVALMYTWKCAAGDTFAKEHLTTAFVPAQCPLVALIMEIERVVNFRRFGYTFSQRILSPSQDEAPLIFRDRCYYFYHRLITAGKQYLRSKVESKDSSCETSVAKAWKIKLWTDHLIFVNSEKCCKI